MIIEGLKLYKFCGISGKRVSVLLLGNELNLQFQMELGGLLFAVDEYGEKIGPLNVPCSCDNQLILHDRFDTAGMVDILVACDLFMPIEINSDGHIVGFLNKNEDFYVEGDSNDNVIDWFEEQRKRVNA
jgi:hypothetical protein